MIDITQEALREIIMSGENVMVLDGKLERKEGWSYCFDIQISSELQEEFIKLKKEKEEIEKLQQEWRNRVAKVAKEKLPPSWKIKSVGVPSYNKVQCFSGAEGLQYNPPVEQPKPQIPIVKTDPYEALSYRSDLKQILNSGVLTKEEKRKVLGLPPQPPKQTPAVPSDSDQTE